MFDDKTSRNAMLLVLTHTFKPVVQQIGCKTNLNVGGKTCNIAFQPREDKGDREGILHTHPIP